jgi:hypothetical protein
MSLVGRGGKRKMVLPASAELSGSCPATCSGVLEDADADQTFEVGAVVEVEVVVLS